MLGGTRLTTIANGIVAFALYGIAFIGGWVEQIATVRRQRRRALRRHDDQSRVSGRRDVPASRARAAAVGALGVQLTPFTPVSVPSVAMIVWALAFVVVALLLAIRTFRHRPL